jgi:hypothetical protein
VAPIELVPPEPLLPEPLLPPEAVSVLEPLPELPEPLPPLAVEPEEPEPPAPPEGLVELVAPEPEPPAPPPASRLLHALSDSAATTASAATVACLKDVFMKNSLLGFDSWVAQRCKGSRDCPDVTLGIRENPPVGTRSKGL